MTPSFIKQLVRRRMADTGEKYTEALRAVTEDVDAARASYGRKPFTAADIVRRDPDEPPPPEIAATLEALREREAARSAGAS